MSYRGSIPLYWRLQKSKYNLIGKKCVVCGNVYFPPKNLCPKCRRKGKLEDFQFSGNGEIVSYTIIRVPPSGFERQAPYAVAIVKLYEGPNVTGQIVGDIDKVDTGKNVRMVFRRIYEDGKDGIIHYGFKFELVDDGTEK